MLTVFIKHAILEHCINMIGSTIHNNFIIPNKKILYVNDLMDIMFNKLPITLNKSETMKSIISFINTSKTKTFVASPDVVAALSACGYHDKFNIERDIFAAKSYIREA